MMKKAHPCLVHKPIKSSAAGFAAKMILRKPIIGFAAAKGIGRENVLFSPLPLHYGAWAVFSGHGRLSHHWLNLRANLNFYLIKEISGPERFSLWKTTQENRLVKVERFASTMDQRRPYSGDQSGGGKSVLPSTFKNFIYSGQGSLMDRAAFMLRHSVERWENTIAPEPLTLSGAPVMGTPAGGGRPENGTPAPYPLLNRFKPLHLASPSTAIPGITADRGRRGTGSPALALHALLNRFTLMNQLFPSSVAPGTPSDQGWQEGGSPMPVQHLLFNRFTLPHPVSTGSSMNMAGRPGGMPVDEPRIQILLKKMAWSSTFQRASDPNSKLSPDGGRVGSAGGTDFYPQEKARESVVKQASPHAPSDGWSGVSLVQRKKQQEPSSSETKENPPVTARQIIQALFQKSGTALTFGAGTPFDRRQMEVTRGARRVKGGSPFSYPFFLEHPFLDFGSVLPGSSGTGVFLAVLPANTGKMIGRFMNRWPSLSWSHAISEEGGGLVLADRSVLSQSSVPGLERFLEPILEYRFPEKPAEKNIGSPVLHETVEAVMTKKVQEAVKTITRPEINVNTLADEVYRLLESKFRIEKERRGIFR